MVREAIDAADVLQASELTDIVVYEVAARRLRDVPESEPAEDFGVQAHGTDEAFETRARLYLRTDEAEFVTEIGAFYTFSEPLRLSKPVAQEFLSRVGIMAVYPFIREQVFSSARRIGVASPVLGLLRAGQFVISDGDEPPALSE
ncbi:hypothetical protein NS206_00505 [Microbacterium testaceum]|uniref:hypothetical protein n=1 Tax=Microbacterium testaceum TaxID=2033 RepID=UPI0007345504|nr:hypothetical protein [Microbacterium testaceum]KTS70380.1 hypothetical protein NS206_00505 [Microbacterium testaceum]